MVVEALNVFEERALKRDSTNRQVYLSHSQVDFLVTFQECCSYQEAAKRSGTPISQHYIWMDQCEGVDGDYKWHFRMIERAINDQLEQEAIRRGIEGVVEYVYHKGEVIGEKVNYSDMLLSTVLRARKQEYARPGEVGEKPEAQQNVVLVMPSNNRDQDEPTVQNITNQTAEQVAAAEFLDSAALAALPEKVHEDEVL